MKLCALKLVSILATAHAQYKQGASFDPDAGEWPAETCFEADIPLPLVEPISPYYTSRGSCYIPSFEVYCNVAEADCEGTYYPPGYVSNYDGCCHCEGGCIKSAEEEHSANEGTCGNYPDTIRSVGSCYEYLSTSGVTCNIEQTDCEGTGGTYYDPGYVSGYGGCCHCYGDCDQDIETGDDCTYPDAPVVTVTAAASTSTRVRDLKAMSFYTMSKARRQRKLEGEDEIEEGCTYSDACCRNPDTGDCVLMGHPPKGHDDVDIHDCPTVEDGGSGFFTEYIDESQTGRHEGCCKEEAASVDWAYIDGSSTGADIGGNTGCQRDLSCVYAETCCYNTFLDHKCYLYKGLPTVAVGHYGQADVACPQPPGEGWIYESSEEDGRNNGCCEDFIDIGTHMPNNFQGEAVDGVPCFTEVEKTQLLADCTEYTGKWFGYLQDGRGAPTAVIRSETDAGTIYADEVAAVEAGCHVGDWVSKRAPGCKFDALNLAAELERLGVNDGFKVTGFGFIGSIIFTLLATGFTTMAAGFLCSVSFHMVVRV
ncbi:hypothetical protein TrVE_jg13865 [Triparma verrucosa]|uniref:Uncharacterized protein n=1 Tax=Triparma verrucosa TaxID=1606542 RepID=A0A9W7BWX4_9STRA|nr:hypothetical protein TrVE_jg13865 [Triparma verrucosa]